MVTKEYKDLIERFPLMPIKSESHLDKAHSIAQSLMLRKEPLSSDEKGYLEVLLDEIEKYERKNHNLQLEAMPPHKLLQSFMKDHNLKQIDLQPILGTSSGVTSELVSGKRELTKEHCVKLGQYFKVTPAAFLPKVFA